MKMNKLKNNQTGAASLITVIILAIILSIVTTGLLRLSVQDARQATDDDLTNRAFYAAESGLSDAVRFIQKELADTSNTYELNGDTCALPSGETGDLGPASLNTAYTCMLIDMEPEEIVNTINAGGLTQFNLNSAPTGNDVIRIRWHSFDEDGPTPTFRADDSLPEQSSWGDAPALLRVNLFSTPRGGGSLQRNDINNYVIFIRSSGDSPTTWTQAGADGDIVEGTCTANIVLNPYDGYACQALIDLTDFNSNDYSARISTLYRTATVSVSFDEPNRSFTGVQALVDVTGRAADVYRRVRASIDLGGDAASALPSFAVQSAADICKDILVTDIVSYNCP